MTAAICPDPNSDRRPTFNCVTCIVVVGLCLVPSPPQTPPPHHLFSCTQSVFSCVNLLNLNVFPPRSTFTVLQPDAIPTAESSLTLSLNPQLPSGEEGATWQSPPQPPRTKCCMERDGLHWINVSHLPAID